MSASFRVSLLFAWLRLCQDQVICALSKALANSPKVTKKSYVAVLIFNALILKIHLYYPYLRNAPAYFAILTLFGS